MLSVLEKTTTGQLTVCWVPGQSTGELSSCSLPEYSLHSTYANSAKATICLLLIQIKMVLQDKPTNARPQAKEKTTQN